MHWAGNDVAWHAGAICCDNSCVLNCLLSWVHFYCMVREASRHLQVAWKACPQTCHRVQLSLVNECGHTPACSSAVNSYLRSILASSAPIREDFDSRSCQAQRLPAAGHISIAATVHQNGQLLTDQPHMAAVPVLAIRQPTIAAAQQCQWDLAGANSNPLCSSSAAPCATAALMPAAAPNALTLQSLPASVLDSVLALLDLQSLVCAANSCRALYKTAQSDSIWRRLFGQRWGSVIFPISKYGKSRDCSNTGSQQVAAQETANTWRTAAAAGQVQTHRADAHSADVLHDGRLGTKTAAPANAGTAAAGANPGSAGSNSNPAFVSRWTGSSTFPDLNTDSCALERAPAAEISTVAAKSSGSGAGRSQHVSHSKIEHNTCSCSSCACVPAVARCGSWQFQYKQQHSYQAARKCPMCGAATVVPVVYGFPSGPLLAGMAKKRLLLGGDHLIDR